MRLASINVGILIVAAAAFSGCGKRAVEAPRRNAAQTAGVPLPEWAPENPSPEFLRAARVLKPIPPEIWRRFGEQAGPEIEAILERFPNTYAPAWEFFGSLSDEQIEHLRSSGTVRVPLRSMTASQRHILIPTSMPGARPWRDRRPCGRTG